MSADKGAILNMKYNLPDRILREIVSFAKEHSITKIILFGSYAYGIPTEDSDIDLCIIESSIHSKAQEKAKIRALLKDINISKDILVENSVDFKKHSSEQWINTALYDAAHKGIVIYAKK